MKFSLRLLYLYLFSFVGLLITVIGGIQLVDLGLKTYVLKVTDYPIYAGPLLDADGKPLTPPEDDLKRQEEESSNQRKRNLSTALSMIAIGAPLYLYHWKTIKKENK